jgi:hypothetical protein
MPNCPGNLDGDGGAKKVARNAPGRKPQKHTKKTAHEAADRKAALAFEKKQERRDRERAKQKAAQRKERERRQKAVDRAQSGLDAACQKHDEGAADIRAKIEALEEQARTEDARWGKELSTRPR